MLGRYPRSSLAHRDPPPPDNTLPIPTLSHFPPPNSLDMFRLCISYPKLGSSQLLVIAANLTPAAGWEGRNVKGLQILKLAEGGVEARAEV